MAFRFNQTTSSIPKYFQQLKIDGVWKSKVNTPKINPPKVKSVKPVTKLKSQRIITETDGKDQSLSI